MQRSPKTEVVQVIQDAQANPGRSRMKSAQRSPLYSPLWSDDNDTEDEVESDPVPQVDAQDLQYEQGPEDKSEAIIYEKL